MGTPILSFDVEHPLGSFGLVLMLVLAALANHGYAERRSIPGRISSFLARRAIDGIAMIGWFVDHVPPYPSGLRGPGLRPHGFPGRGLRHP